MLMWALREVKNQYKRATPVRVSCFVARQSSVNEHPSGSADQSELSLAGALDQSQPSVA